MTTTQRTNYRVNEIAELFPSLMEIKDESLRDKVAAVWNEAITTGCGGKGWTFDELRAVKFTLLAGDIDMTFVEHLNSCARQSLDRIDHFPSRGLRGLRYCEAAGQTRREIVKVPDFVAHESRELTRIFRLIYYLTLA